MSIMGWFGQGDYIEKFIRKSFQHSNTNEFIPSSLLGLYLLPNKMTGVTIPGNGKFEPLYLSLPSKTPSGIIFI